MLARPSLKLLPLILLLLPGISRAEGEKEGMPQLDPHSYASQLFWLSVFFILTFLFLRFIGLPRLTAIIDMRASKIDGDINAADILRAQAEAAEVAYETMIASAHAAARRIVAETQEQNVATLALKTKEASAEADHQISLAVKRIDNAKDAALHGLRDVTLGLAADITAKLIGRAPTVDRVSLAVDKAAGGGA
jgi:F-type H+-transporting ATPase subunit b